MENFENRKREKVSPSHEFQGAMIKTEDYKKYCFNMDRQTLLNALNVFAPRQVG